MSGPAGTHDVAAIHSHPRFSLMPTEARRLLRFELERLVDDADVRHETIAGWLGVSRPAVTAALLGKTLFSRSALEVFLTRLDRSEWFPRLSGLLTAARRKTPEAACSGSQHPRDAVLVVGLEAFASTVTVFDPYLIPPHLQTQMYAVALTKLDDLGSNRGRERRQAPLLESGDGHGRLSFMWITSEHALHRRVGGSAVTHDQLACLVAMTERPNIAIRVIPARVELPPTSPFQLIEGTPPVVVEPSRMAMHVTDEPTTVAYFRQLLGGLTERALSPEASAAYLAGLLP